VHQVGFFKNEYVEMRGQENTLFIFFYTFKSSLKYFASELSTFLSIHICNQN